MVNRARKFKFILAAIVGFSVMAVIGVFLQVRQNSPDHPALLETKNTNAVMTLSKVHQTATKDGKVQWQLDADTAELESGTGKMILREPKITFFMDNGTRAYLSAREGILNTNNNNVQVRGNVKLHNDRYTMVTQVLAYEHEKRVLHTDAPVQITGKIIKIKAKKMRYDLNKDKTYFNGPVEGILYDIPAI